MNQTHPRADRNGNAYHVIQYVDRKGQVVRVQILSPSRQAKKATGLHGRQWVKYRKAAQRARRVAR